MAYTFFLGANSKDGFVSLYPHLAAEGRRLFSVKGGPGCGKSTCIGRLSDALGGAEEYIRCSSDPDSLDGALLPGLAIVDGTAPHVLEPAFPGSDGDYLPMPLLLDRAGLAAKAPALYALKAASRHHYDQAYRLLKAASLLREDRRQQLAAMLKRPPENRAKALLRQVPRGEGPGRLYRRFLDGITPKGVLCLWDTVSNNFSRVIALEDSCGLCRPLLEDLLAGCLKKGQLVYGCYDPLEPDRLRHLLLPGCSLAFVTKEAPLPFAPRRTLHPEATLDQEALRPRRADLRKLAHREKELVEDAVQCISAAHRLHDRMEELYAPHLDKPTMEANIDTLLERIR